MMMSLGSLGGGGPSSSSSPSSSNLSALAPPFTVERFNSRTPTSNPLVQFSDPQPYAAAAAPFGHATWQYSNPSAPPTHIRRDMHQKPDLDMDSTRITPVPLGNDYPFGYSVPQSSNDVPQTTPWSTVVPGAKSSSGTFLYQSDGKVESYYPHYGSSVVNHDSPLVALSEPSYDMLPSSGLVSSPNIPSRVDYTQCLSGLEYPPQWHGGWNGLIDSKRGKQVELGVGFSLDNTTAGDSRAYGDHMNQGFYTVERGDSSGISYGQFSDAIGRESSSSLIRMEPAYNMSHLAQKVSLLPFDSSRTTNLSSSFTIPASHPPGSSLHSPKNVMKFQKSQSPYEKCTLAHDSTVGVSLSVAKPSPGLATRPPPSALVPLKTSSGKTIDTGDVAAIQTNEGLGNDNSSEGKEHSIFFNTEVEEGSLFSSQLKYQKEGNGQLFSLPSAVMEELSSKPQTGDDLNNIFKPKSGSQVLSINVSDICSLSGDCFQAIKSSDNVPDSLDYHNFAVDSPCWKGAPASHVSPFGGVETESTHPFVKKIDKFCRFDLQVDRNFSLPKDPVSCFSEKAVEDKVHECSHAGRGISLTPVSTSEADCTARELMSVDAVKGSFKGPILATSQGVEVCEEYNKPREDNDLPVPSKKDSESKSSVIKQLGVEELNLTPSELIFQTSVMDSVLNTSDTTDGSVAVRAAETVLCSSSSEEGAPEQAKQFGCESARQMDAQALVKVLQCLSELLLLNCLTDSSALKEEDFEALKHVISNLDVLALKKMAYLTQPQERVLRQQVTCHKVRNSLDPHTNNAAGGRQFENEVGTKSHCHLDNRITDNEMRNHNVTQENTDKFQTFSPVTDDLDVLRDDNIAQAIRKVLMQNFRSEEEMDSQALLFKNLWLEAEAKLCSISYKARFDRMKVEMQKFKVNQTQENAAASENMSSSLSSHDLRISDLPPPKVENGTMQKTTAWSQSSLSSKANDVEASAMTRFHILKCHDDPKSSNLAGKEAGMVDDISSVEMPFLEDQAMDGRLNVAVEPNSHKKCDVNQGHVGLHIGGSQNEPVKDGMSSTSNTDNVEATFMTRFNILKCRDELKDMNLVGQQAGFIDAVYSDIIPFCKDQPEDGRSNFAVEGHSHKTGDVYQGHVGGSGYESIRDFFFCVPDDPGNQSSAPHGQRNQYSLGFNDNGSSDWEHVLKDDASWR